MLFSHQYVTVLHHIVAYYVSHKSATVSEVTSALNQLELKYVAPESASDFS